MSSRTSGIIRWGIGVCMGSLVLSGVMLLLRALGESPGPWTRVVLSVLIVVPTLMIIEMSER